MCDGVVKIYDIFLCITYISLQTMNSTSTLSSQFSKIIQKQHDETVIELSFSLCHEYDFCWHLYSC